SAIASPGSSPRLVVVALVLEQRESRPGEKAANSIKFQAGEPRASLADSAHDRLVDALRSHGSRVVERGDRKATAQCPAHEDRNPSLSLQGIEGQVLVYCHGGCD